MFGDTLLESSSALRKKKRWPMAAAFTVEVVFAGIVVLIPLFSTGAISITASHVPLPIPMKPMPLEAMKPVPVNHHASGLVDPGPRRMVVALFSDNPNAIYRGRPADETTSNRHDVTPTGLYADSHMPTELMGSGPASNVKPAGPKRVVSQLTEAQLVNRVEPVYPRIAVVSNIQGQVKLHAIIARDGSIQSLNAISGHPMLVSAAIDAVRQWRYRPYILNGEAVEVETLITVNFRKDVH
jgi:periplasmic protein TonB